MLNELKQLGVDIQAGLDRFMGNGPLYERMLKKFPTAAEKDILAVLNSGDTEGAAGLVHELKGVTGNLSITPLYEQYTDILGLLRSGQTKEARLRLARLLRTQEEIVACIRRHC